MSIPTLALNDGSSIPQLGLGTYGLWNEEGSEVIARAIELGYRHVDTAARYENEVAVGEGLRRSGVERSELYVTTKLDGEWQGEDRAVAGLAACLERLGLEYVDLLLIHWPLPQRDEYVSTWRTFERLKTEGLTRSIGVSNFMPAHLERLAAETATVPAVNQIQLTPVIQRREQRAYDTAHGIVTESWSPIKGVLDTAQVRQIADATGRTPAQVVLRWHLQNGLVAIPKSASVERLAENLAATEFVLDDSAMALLDTLDEGPTAGVNSEVSGH